MHSRFMFKWVFVLGYINVLPCSYSLYHEQVKELLRRRIHGYELQPAMLFGPFIFIGFLVAALLVTFPRLDDSQQGVTQQVWLNWISNQSSNSPLFNLFWSQVTWLNQQILLQQAALYYFLLLPAMLVFGTMTDVMKNRAAFYRERSSSTYSSIAYIVHFFIFTILPVVRNIAYCIHPFVLLFRNWIMGCRCSLLSWRERRSTGLLGCDQLMDRTTTSSS